MKTGNLQVAIAFAGENGTVTTTAKSLVEFGFTAEEVRAADNAFISVESASIRWGFLDILTPTTAIGIPQVANDTFDVWGWTNLENFRIIAQSGTATLNIILSRQGSKP